MRTEAEGSAPLHRVAGEGKTLKAPTLIVWGTDDIYFDVKWSHWLAETIPGTRKRVEFDGARIFFPRSAGQSSTRRYARTGRRALFKASEET
jgi:pimeloyl-ACP methyl ester carboxylesterase